MTVRPFSASRLFSPLALAALTAITAAFAAAGGSGASLMQTGVALGGPVGGGAAVSAMLAQDAGRREA